MITMVAFTTERLEKIPQKIWFQSNLYKLNMYYKCIYIRLKPIFLFGFPRSVVKATMVIIYIYKNAHMLKHANSSAVFRYPIIYNIIHKRVCGCAFAANRPPPVLYCVYMGHIMAWHGLVGYLKVLYHVLRCRRCVV